MTKRENHLTLLANITALQTEWSGKEMPVAVGEQINALADEALALQKDLEAALVLEGKLAQVREFGGRMPAPSMPPEAPAAKADGVAGYLSIGDLVAASDGLKDFLGRGLPKGAFHLASIPSLVKGRRDHLVPLTRAQLAEVKAVPTVGANVIAPDQMADVSRVTEHAVLTLRDVLSVGTTSSNAVRYTRSSYTRAAAAVAQGVEKPESTMAFTSELAPVRKVAVWMPVNDEQLADVSELSRMINEELVWDVNKHLEELMAYGSGIGEEFDGLLNDTAVPVARTVGGDTLIDTVRRAITDVRVAGYDPNAALIHPRDWETIVLEKGSDSRYVWVVVTDGNTQRLWGVPVIESIAMEDYQGNLTEERNILVGDFRRGATLWDREQTSIQTGWIDRQFVENRRTILAELRAAFGIRRPKAFVKHVTQAAVVS